MKRSSFFILLAILIAFVAVQGWLLRALFFQQSAITAVRASIMGETLLVGTPISGIVRSVQVAEGQRVSRGQPLFLIMEQSPLNPDGDALSAIVAQRAGTVYGIDVTVDSFVQASQILARIVDTDPQALYVEAVLPVTPEKLPAIGAFQPATVQGDFLRDTDPIPAVVTSVGLYDAEHGTVDVRLRMLRMPSSEHHDTLVGLPVAVTVMSRAQNIAGPSAQAKER